MKKLLLLGVFGLFILVAEAQEETKPSIKFSGFVRYEFFYDSYKSVDTRDGEVYLYPLPAKFDVNGDDINEVGQLEMLSLQTRVRAAFVGPDAFGAKITGLIEGDFLGISQNDTRQLRLRHAFLKMSWDKADLLMGQYWHPMFVTQCFPGTVSMGAGVPFHVLNRMPQARLTYKPTEALSLMAGMGIHGYHKSKGSATAQRDAGLPDAQVQLMYNTKSFLAGFTFGNKWLKPRTFIDSTSITRKVSIDKMKSSYYLNVFSKVTSKPLTIKAEVIYGEDLTHFVMIGGYGANVNVKDDANYWVDYDYSDLKTLSVWGDMHTNGKKFQAGLFLGYSKITGAEDTFYDIGATRSGMLNYIFRVSPRIVFISGKTDFGIEYMATGAGYATVKNEKYEVEHTALPVVNHRLIFSARYKF